MSEEQRPKLEYAAPGRRSRAEIMTAMISLIFSGGIALAVPVWLVWINEWQARPAFLILAMLFMAFALWQIYRSMRILLRSADE